MVAEQQAERSKKDSVPELKTKEDFKLHKVPMNGQNEKTATGIDAKLSRKSSTSLQA